MEVDAMTKQEMQEASKRINEIQLSLWEVEKMMDKDSRERDAVLAVRKNLGIVDLMLQMKVEGE